MTRHLRGITLAALLLLPTAIFAQKFARPVNVIEPAQPDADPKKAKPTTDFKPATGTDPNPKSLEIGDAEMAHANELVGKLGSPLFKERDAATRELRKLGRKALPALQQARDTSGSAEVQMRIGMVIPAAEADDMKARVSCFLADLDGKHEHNLPGWKKYTEVAGNDKQARELFSEMLKNTNVHAMLLAADRSPGEASQVMLPYFREMQNQMWGRGFDAAVQNMKTPELAGLTFLEALFGDKDMGQMGQWGQYLSASNQWYNSVDFQAVLNRQANAKYANPLKKIIGRWLETRETAPGLQQAMNFAQSLYGYNSKEWLKFCAKILTAEVTANTYYIKSNAMQQLGSQNAKEFLPQIAKVFEDATVIQQAFKNPGQPEQHEILMSDYALSIALHLSAQDPKDYGMEINKQFGSKWQQGYAYFKEDAKLKTDEKRKAAFKKWAEWEKTKKDEPKKDDTKKDDGKKTDGPKKDESKKDEGTMKEADTKKKLADEKAKKEEELKKEEERKKGETATATSPPPPKK